MDPHLPVSQEAANFVSACDAVHTALVLDRLSITDRDLIKFSGLALLNKLALA